MINSTVISAVVSSWLAACGLLMCAAMAVASEALPEAVPKPLSGGWALRTGVFTKQEATASIDKGVFTIEGGGYRGGTWVRGTVVPADRAQMTAAFVYKAFKGDFILTARRIAYDKRKAHQNCGSGLAAISDLKGWDCPVAVNASEYGGKPFWYRMIRKGDRIGLYEGPDGQKWMASNAGALIAGTVYAGLYTEGWDEQTMAQYDNVTIDEQPKFTYNTTWLGNDFEGGPRNTVGASIIGLAVAPDGTCITTGVNGEQENEMGRYRDGQTLNTRPSNFVGASGNALVLLPDGFGWVANKKWLQRFDWDRYNGKDGQGVEVASQADDNAIRGLAVHEGELFAASRPDNAIIVLDLTTMKPKRTLAFARPGPLAVDAKGVLWVVEEGWVSGHPYAYPYEKPFRILGLDRGTGKQVGEITGVELPTALTADTNGPSKARLLIADNGKDQQVKIFDVGGAKPKLAGTLGAKGGVYAGTPGEMKPGKFNGLTGVGSDAKGNIYVAGAGYPYRVAISEGMPNISQLKAFAPTAIDKPEPDALWVLTCPGFNCMGACYDAKTSDAYIGGLARYAYDAKRPLGKEWQIAGTTANLRDDSASESLLRTFQAAPQIRWIDGQRFLTLRDRTYKLDKNGNLGQLVRYTCFNPNFIRDQQEQARKGAADPRSLEALFAGFPANLPKPTLDKDKRPTDWRFWEWVDGQGGLQDGKQQREEYHDLTPLITNLNPDFGFWPSGDADGNWWICGPGKKDIQFRKFIGLKNGVPTWANELKSYPVPALITRVLGVRHLPERDIMDIVGQTAENPGGHEYQAAEIVRFINWSTKPAATTRIVFHERGVYLPFGGEGFWQVPHLMEKVVGLAIAGDVVYATNRTGAVRAYDLNKGNLIEWMDAGPEVFGASGFFDVGDTAVNASEISPTEHLVLRQSNYTIRILAHRWNPTVCTTGRLPPAPEVWAQPRSGAVELMWGGRTGITGTVKGYQIYRADKKEGPYQKAALAEGGSFLDQRPAGRPVWYRVATINLVGEGPQSEPVFAGSAAPMAKRLVSTGRIDATGFDLATRGNWLGVYGSEAAYLAQDHLPKDAKGESRRDFTAGRITGFGPMWGNTNPVGPSKDEDQLQSVVMPGMRCNESASAWWGTTRGVFSITDGKPRRLTIAMSRNATYTFSDIDTGGIILSEKVVWPKDGPKIGYIAFAVSGRFSLAMDGEPIKAILIDPAGK